MAWEVGRAKFETLLSGLHSLEVLCEVVWDIFHEESVFGPDNFDYTLLMSGECQRTGLIVKSIHSYIKQQPKTLFDHKRLTTLDNAAERLRKSIPKFVIALDAFRSPNPKPKQSASRPFRFRSKDSKEENGLGEIQDQLRNVQYAKSILESVSDSLKSDSEFLKKTGSFKETEFAELNNLEVQKFLGITGEFVKHGFGFSGESWEKSMSGSWMVSLWARLNDGANPKVRFSASPRDKKPYTRRTFRPIDLAAQRNLAAVKLLYAYRADIHTNDDNTGKSPIHFSAQEDQVAIIRFLLDHGVNIESKSDHNDTALHFACREGNLSTVKFLIKNNAAVSPKNAEGDTPLIRAASVKKGIATEIVKYLVSCGASVDEADNSGYSALFIAISAGHESTVLYLLQAGADISRKTAIGNSVMNFAVRRGINMTRIVMAYGASPLTLHTEDNNLIAQVCLIDYRVPGSVEELIQVSLQSIAFLVGAGVDPDQRNPLGWSAVHYAVVKNSPELAQCLLDLGVDVERSVRAHNRPFRLRNNKFASKCPGGNAIDIAKWVHQFEDSTTMVQLLEGHVEKLKNQSRLTNDLIQNHKQRLLSADSGVHVHNKIVDNVASELQQLQMPDDRLEQSDRYEGEMPSLKRRYTDNVESDK